MTKFNPQNLQVIYSSFIALLQVFSSPFCSFSAILPYRGADRVCFKLINRALPKTTRVRVKLWRSINFYETHSSFSFKQGGACKKVEPLKLMSNSILIIENDSLIQEVLGDALKWAGFTPIDVYNGRDAIISFRTLQPDIGLVIMDMGLPDMNGSEILLELEAIQANIPVIVASGQDKQILHRRFHSHPNVTILPKPFDLNVMLEHVQAKLDNSP